MNTASTVTVLIHGGQVGAWVWDAVRSQLVLSELPPNGRVVLVGHSMGAAIALAVASQVPDRISHVVLIAGMVPHPGKPLLSAFPFAMRLVSSLLLCLTPEFSQPPKVVRAKLLNGLPPAQAEEAASKFTKESSSLFFDRVEWRPNPEIPVTYVRCLSDRGALSPHFQEQLAARLGSKATITSIDACHYAMLEKPAEVAAVINGMSMRKVWCQR